jgi:integral membrane protein
VTPGRSAWRRAVGLLGSPGIMFKSALGRLRVIALVEGVSFLVLLFVAMPLKYAAGMPMAVRIVGAIHGGLFLLFLWALMQATDEAKWPWSRAGAAFVASVVPFGTFVFDRSLRAEQARAAAPAQ